MSMSESHQDMGLIKECIMWFVISTQRMGFTSQNTLTHTLLSNFDSYIMGIGRYIVRQVESIFENEDFLPIEIADLVDYGIYIYIYINCIERFVSSLGIKLDSGGAQNAYPYTVPYTHFVVKLNTQIKQVSIDLAEFMRYLYDGDEERIYRGLNQIIEITKSKISSFLHSIQLSLLQNAIMQNNIEYFQRCFGHILEYMSKITKTVLTKNYNEFSAYHSLNQLK